jgi:uncharacterized protein (TIRG00374 family)
VSAEEHPAAAGPEEVTSQVGGMRAAPRDMIVRGILTLILLGLVAWLLLKNIGDINEVADALASVSSADAVLLVVLTLIWQLGIATQLALTVPGLGIVRGFVAVECASAASNVIPGPSGTATRLGVLRSWGFYTEDFARSWLFTSALTNLTVLTMPAVAIILVAVAGGVSGSVVIAALIGLAVAIVGIVLIALILRSERFARGFGRRTGRVAAWAAGVTHRRPSDKDFEEISVHFRDDLRATLHEKGPLVALTVVATYCVQGIIFGLSLRAVGLDHSELSVGAIAVVYTIVRLLTIVNFTPGGVGVTEALYTSALLVATDGADQSEIVAGVILFRGLTYVGPILLGAVAVLVWRFRKKWRVQPPAEPVGAAAVGAVIADRRPPGDD